MNDEGRRFHATDFQRIDFHFSDAPRDPFYLDGHVAFGFDADHWHGRIFRSAGQVELQATPEEWLAWGRALCAIFEEEKE